MDSEHHHHQRAPRCLATAEANEPLLEARKMSFRWVGGRRDAGGGTGSCQIGEEVSIDEQPWVGVDPGRQRDLVGWGEYAHHQVLSPKARKTTPGVLTSRPGGISDAFSPALWMV